MIELNENMQIGKTGKTLKNLVDYNIYSNNETIIGEWQGQVLYRKIVNIGYLIPNSKKKYSTGLANVIIRKYNAYFLNNGASYTFQLNHLNMYNREPNSYEGILIYTGNYGSDIIVENANVSATELDCYVILEYTKI